MAYLRAVGHNFAHAALVNIAHGKDVDADFFTILRSWASRSRAPTDDDVARLGFGLESEEIDELGRSEPIMAASGMP